MWRESSEKPKKLKNGYTTGSCATACCVAAALLLLRKIESPNTRLEMDDAEKVNVYIKLPRGETIPFTICEQSIVENCAYAATIKDAGDDPDVTHGAKIFAKLELIEQKRVEFNAGAGVGVVTRAGLPVAIGEAAINPVPRMMMTNNLSDVADKFHYQGGFSVTIGIEDGERIALKTMNSRLGIMGGLSILGTTGIVRPFSCSAYIASIRQAIDVAYANGVRHIAAATGNRSESAIQNYYHLHAMALIEMGDFVGAVLKHVKKYPFEKLSLCLGFAKLAKFAQGNLNLHSDKSQVDFVFLAEIAREMGADKERCEQIRSANTSSQVQKICEVDSIEIGTKLCQLAEDKTRKLLDKSTIVEVFTLSSNAEIISG